MGMGRFFLFSWGDYTEPEKFWKGVSYFSRTLIISLFRRQPEIGWMMLLSLLYHSDTIKIALQVLAHVSESFLFFSRLCVVSFCGHPSREIFQLSLGEMEYQVAATFARGGQHVITHGRDHPVAYHGLIFVGLQLDLVFFCDNVRITFKMGAPSFVKFIYLLSVFPLVISIASIVMLTMYNPITLQIESLRLMLLYCSMEYDRIQMGAKIDQMSLAATPRNPTASSPDNTFFRFAA